MSEKSNIQWTDATWNIARGCSKVDEDCKYCYMYRDSLDNTRYNPLEVTRTKTVFNIPLKYKEIVSAVWPGKPLIFTSSLTDVFHEGIDMFRHEMWDIVLKTPHLIKQILTKRPERVPELLPAFWKELQDHVWIGTSVGHSKGMQRIDDLLKIPAKTRFLSLEPLHGPVDLSYALRSEQDCENCGGDGSVPVDGGGVQCPNCLYDYRHYTGPSNIHWVIVGGESGNDNGKYKYRPCDLRWIENIIGQCKAAGVPVFVKQLGTHLAKQMGLKDRHGGNIEEWPAHLQIREFPTV